MAPVFIAPQTATAIEAFLAEIKSERKAEFRKACDNIFELSTVFKTQEEIVTLLKDVAAVDGDKVEVAG